MNGIDYCCSVDISSMSKKFQLLVGGGSKWVFSCPFCSYLGRTESKRNERKAALLWNDLQNSWVFSSAKKGSPQCSGGGKTLEGFLSALDVELAENYRMERWHSGTTGQEHNCRAPVCLVGVTTES